ncbi:MAG: AMP-binding protein [Bacteroidetes bacterium]|nr:AMP-binding protein [Bacteroidota bacterium]
MHLPEIEQKSVAEINAIQEIALQKHLQYLNEHSTFYQNHFKKHNISLSTIKSIADLARIPVTTKEDLQSFNADFVCVSPAQIIDYVTTSGTLGDPVTFCLTEKDLQRLAYNECISLACTGGNENEIYQLMATLDRRFMAGLAYFSGARMLGAGVVRVGSGIPELQWDTVARIKPSAIITVPSFILKLIAYGEAHQIDYKNSSIKKAICIGEPIRSADFELNTLGKKIKEKWDIELFSTYASTEMGAAFTECSAGKGGHHHPELVIVEFLDEQDNPVKAHEAGEVTVTTLGVEGMPLLRFKTGDVCMHYSEACTCGRTTLRIGPILGRKKQMIKYKGTSIYPSAFYDILNNISHVENYVVEASTNSLGTDEILIRIGCRYVPENFEHEIKDHFRAKLRFSPSIVLSSVEEITKLQGSESGRKPQLFLDKR